MPIMFSHGAGFPKPVVVALLLGTPMMSFRLRGGMTLPWSPEARQDLKDIQAKISQDDAGVANIIVARMVGVVSEQLENGRLGRVAGICKFVISSKQAEYHLTVTHGHLAN